MKKLGILIGLVFLCRSALGAVAVRFEPTTVALGESAFLIIESDQAMDRLPDLSGLVGLFAVGDQQQGVLMEQINGRRKTKHTWTLTVFPRRSGTLSTGPLTVNNETADAAVLTVTEGENTTESTIRIQVSAGRTEAYPEQMIPVTVRLICRDDLNDAKIMPPTISGARIVFLDRDRVYRSVINQEPVRVIERTYAVVPERAGQLTIPPFEVYGTVSTGVSVGLGDLFTQGILFDGLAGTQKDIRIESNPIQITVHPQPADWTGWWLPADRVTLTARDEWPDTIAVGDSLTREIVLMARGVSGEQLPQLTQTGGPSVRVYPSPDKRQTDIADDGTVEGREVAKVVIVPTTAGSVRVPPVRINWFNVQTGRSETAEIPEKVIRVTGNEIAAAPTDIPPQAEPTPVKAKGTAVPTPRVSATVPSEKSFPDHRFWVFMTIGLTFAALGFGLGLGYVLFRRRHPRSYLLPSDTKRKSEKKKTALPDLYPF